ncbi:MAG: glycosyltransferase, partial [Phycisphaerae bacterium]
ERRRDRDVLFIALGEDCPPQRLGPAEIRFVPFQNDPPVVARYYQSADVYVHAARADTFPNAVLEALCTGLPVVATAVGGIPEQVRPLTHQPSSAARATGILTPAGDAEALAAGIERLLKNDPLRQCLADNAARDARERFDLHRQVNDYLAWYRELVSGRSATSGRAPQAPASTQPAPALVYSST